MTNPTATILNTAPSDESTPEEITWDVTLQVGDPNNNTHIEFWAVPHRKMKAWAEKSAAGTLTVKLG